MLWIRIGFNADPDPAFFCLCGSGSRSRVLMTKNWKKFTAEIDFTYIFMIKNLLSLGLHKGRPSYRRSLHPSKENIYQFKFWPFWIWI